MAGGTGAEAAVIRGGATARILPDGRRLYLNHGPIDLVIEARGERAEVYRAYEQAWRAFPPILPELVQELDLLRRPIDEIPDRDSQDTQEHVAPPTPALPHKGGGKEIFVQPLTPSPWMGEGRGGGGPRVCDSRYNDEPSGPVARRMVSACRPYSGVFVTPMAAVAGAVAEHVLEHMIMGRQLSRAYVNNGGDIAVHLSPGQHFACGLVPDLRLPSVCGRVGLTAAGPARGIATSGRACSGQGGRSFSLGIADAVTVLAVTAAAADVAATLIANAVDLPGHAAVVRVPAQDLDPDSDLGERLVTVDLGILSLSEIRRALRRGEREAVRLRQAGLIEAAALLLRHRYVVVGQPLMLAAA